MPNGQTTIELSKRELQVLEMVVTGASNQEIARKLVISVNTVKVHMRNIFEKLNVQSRTEATLKAIQEGLVTVEPDAELAENDEAAIPLTKSFLINPNAALVLTPWQHFYLLLAALLALAVALVPYIPKESRKAAPVLPVIYAQPTQPPPLAQPGSNANSWTTHTPMPTGRAGLALVTYNGQIFAIGGVRANNKATRSVEIFDPATNSWREGASALEAIANIAGAVLNDKIYVPGGCTNEGEAVDSMGIYDPQSDIWSQGPAMPAPRCGYGLAVFNNKLYLFGGWNGQTFEDTIFVFSPTANRWQKSAAKLPRPMGYMGAAALNEAIYVVGGYDGQQEFAQTYAFDPATGHWQEKSPLNEKRGGLGLVSSHNNLYAIGGGWKHPLNTSEKYNPQTDSWESFETPFNSRWRNLGLAIIDTQIYAMGGWDGAEEKYIDSVVSYQFLYQIFLPLSATNK